VQYRELGKTGLRVSLLGLGAVAFGRTDGLKYDVAPRLPSMRDLSELLAAARDAGVNLIDTAPAYGVSEQRLGELLAGGRNDWVLCTKVGEIRTGVSRWDFSGARAAVFGVAAATRHR
jgi:aryl-alcohol dehydrogenase-like predicted oxidoreductase